MANANAGGSFRLTKEHWVIVLLGMLLTAGLAGAGFLVFLDGRIDERLATQFEKLVDERVEATISERLSAALVFAPGDKSIERLEAALGSGRTIYLTYDKPGSVVDHRWYRRCDHVVLDAIANPHLATCFVMRVVDSNFANGTRILTDGTIFEDHIINTRGAYTVRKYEVIEDIINVLTPSEAPGAYREAWWYAAPAPLILP